VVCLFCVFCLFFFSSSSFSSSDGRFEKFTWFWFNDYSRIQYTSDAKCVVSFSSVSSFSFFGNVNSSFFRSIIFLCFLEAAFLQGCWCNEAAHSVICFCGCCCNMFLAVFCFQVFFNPVWIGGKFDDFSDLKWVTCTTLPRRLFLFFQPWPPLWSCRLRRLLWRIRE